MKRFFLAFLLAVASKEAFAAPSWSPDWIGTWGDERVYVFEHPSPRLVYTINTSLKDAGGALPDYVEATVRLPTGIFSARFKPKNWRERVEVPLARQTGSREGQILDSFNPHGAPAAEIDRETSGPLGGGNISGFRLLPNPRRAPVFKTNSVFISRAGGNFGSFAPALRIQGSSAVFDARAFADEINVPTDIALIADLPEGRAFGLVLGAPQPSAARHPASSPGHDQIKNAVLHHRHGRQLRLLARLDGRKHRIRIRAPA